MYELLCVGSAIEQIMSCCQQRRHELFKSVLKDIDFDTDIQVGVDDEFNMDGNDNIADMECTEI